MRKYYCDKIEKLIDKLYSHLYYVANHGHYLWVYKNSDNNLIMVIHGGDREYYMNNPFEIKLIKVDENKTIDKEFDTLDDMISYIRKDLLDDIMIYKL